MVGWAIRDAATDSLLDGRFADRNFTPGSTQKLFTTWIALDLLGPEKTFATELFRTGTMQGDRLIGDLIIKGGGDPAFADPQFGADQGAGAVFGTWFEALRKIGVRSVEGCISGDGTYLLEEGPHPDLLWEDAGNYYAGIVSGLSFNGNLYTAKFSGAATAGKPVALEGTVPAHCGISRFENHLLTGPADGHDSAYIIGGFPSTRRDLRGTFPAGRTPFTIKGSLPNPAWTCAREFRDFLAANGIASAPPKAACGDSTALPNRAGLGTGIAIPGARHLSAPLKDLIRFTNQKSDNNYAAQILALVGKEAGPSGDWRGGLAVLDEYLNRHGFNRAEIHLKDGNGLSRYNWISPGQTARLLSYASRQKAFPEFQASLLGKDSAGKLERYGSGWEGRLWVKTGTLEGVSALAGYLKCKSGRLAAFSITANNFEGKGSDMQKAFGPLLRDWAARY